MSTPAGLVPATAVAALDVQHVSVTLGSTRLLDDVTLTVPPGARVALIGPNGSGKTTLLKAILGLVPISEGVIRIAGLRPHDARSAVGYLPQHKSFDRSFPATALEVVVASLRGAWPVHIHAAERDRAQAALARFGAAHLSGKRVANLSGGELQRVFLARALVLAPRLLLLDEPNTGLDPEARCEVEGILCRLADERDLAMIVVTHDLRGLQSFATHVVYLDRRIVREGDPETILREAPDHPIFGHVHPDDHLHDHGPTGTDPAPRR